MTLEQARRVLSEYRHVHRMIEETIAEMGKLLLTGGQVPTVEQIAESRGVVKGLRIVQSFYSQAEAVLAEERARLEQQEEVITAPSPPGLVSAMLDPVHDASTPN